MRFPFVELPAQPLTVRPVVLVGLEGLERELQHCLVDTGSLKNRFGRWLADAAGIDLVGAPEERLAVGGVLTTARMTRVDLVLGDRRFDAPVWFCEPWPFEFQLLGQDGFLRYFRVTICAAEEWLDCEPEPVA